MWEKGLKVLSNWNILPHSSYTIRSTGMVSIYLKTIAYDDSNNMHNISLLLTQVAQFEF